MLLTANPLLIDNALWIAAFVLLVPTTIFAIAGPAIVRRFVPLERLRSNNEVAGFKFATVGVIYAVLLAFAILVVWERFNQADIGVANEASAAATVFRLTQGLDAAHGAAIRKATTDYLKAAVAKDWPGHEVLDIPDWSIAKNDQWVQSVIDRKMDVYVGSPTTWSNLWDAAAGRSTVFGRELQQFLDAGYTWDGWTLIPPGG